jgi:hypothetical protein
VRVNSYHKNIFVLTVALLSTCLLTAADKAELTEKLREDS